METLALVLMGAGLLCSGMGAWIVDVRPLACRLCILASLAWAISAGIVLLGMVALFPGQSLRDVLLFALGTVAQASWWTKLWLQSGPD